MKFRSLHRNVKIRVYVTFAFGLAQATITPFMGVYFARAFGQTVAGALLMVSVLATVVASAGGGYYADRVGRKRVMVVSEAFFLLAYMAMAFANSPWFDSPLLTFMAFLVVSICFGFHSPADDAMLLDVTTAESRPVMYGIMYWSHNLTTAIGASVGAVLFDASRFLLFCVMAGVVLGSLLTTAFLIKETHRPTRGMGQKGPEPARNIFHNYRSVVRDLPFLRYIAAGALAMAVEFQLTNYIGIRLSNTVHRHILARIWHAVIHVDGLQLFGWLQTENTVIVVLFAAMAMRLGRNWTARTVLYISLILNVVGYSLMDVATSPWLLLALMVLATLGEMLGVPTRQAFLGDLAPESARSSYVALNGMTFSLARVLASIGVMVGAVVPAWGMAVLSGLVGMIGLGLFQSVTSEAHRRRTLSASELQRPAASELIDTAVNAPGGA